MFQFVSYASYKNKETNRQYTSDTFGPEILCSHKISQVQLKNINVFITHNECLIPFYGENLL